MKKLIPIVLSALMLTECARLGNQINSYRQISMDEAVTMMEQEREYMILDVRTPEEFAEKHIPNAINVPNENIGNGKACRFWIYEYRGVQRYHRLERRDRERRMTVTVQYLHRRKQRKLRKLDERRYVICPKEAFQTIMCQDLF